MLQAQRRHGMCLIEPDDRVELLSHRRFGIVALQFGVRSIDHANEAFEAEG